MKNSPPFSLLLVLLFPPLSFSLSIYFWLQFTVICKAKWTSRNCQVGGAMVVVVIVIFFYDRSTVVVLHIPFFFDWSSSFFPEFTFFSLSLLLILHLARVPLLFFFKLLRSPASNGDDDDDAAIVPTGAAALRARSNRCAISHFLCHPFRRPLYIRKKTSLTFDGRQKS